MLPKAKEKRGSAAPLATAPRQPTKSSRASMGSQRASTEKKEGEAFFDAAAAAAAAALPFLFPGGGRGEAPPAAAASGSAAVGGERRRGRSLFWISTSAIVERAGAFWAGGRRKTKAGGKEVKEEKGPRKKCFFMFGESLFFHFLVFQLLWLSLRSASLRPSIQNGLQWRRRQEASTSMGQAPAAEAARADNDDGDGIECAKVHRRCP